MRILVDYRPALRARTGVGEAVHELARAYSHTYDDEIVLFTSSWKDRLDPRVPRAMGAAWVDRRIPVRVLNTLWHRASWPPVELLAGPIDVVHAAHPLLIPARRAAQVVTVYDLFFLTDPERTRAEIRRDYVPLAADHARRADAVVTSSCYTRDRLVGDLGVAADRVYICPLGAPSWRRLGRRPHVPADGCVLFVGTLEPRKNIGVLLDAYERLAARRAVPRLVLAGGAGPDAREWLARIARPPLNAHVAYRGYVAEADREALFAEARLLVLPSLDEGFGLPALEAMAAGIPVIASNRGSLPEVVGDAGTLVDPTDVDGLAAAIERSLTDDALAEAQGALGLARAATFTWQRGASVLRDAYTDAVARRRERG